MRAAVTRDPAAFRARTAAWLDADPVGHNLAATVSRRAGAETFAWAETDAGALTGVAVRTGGFPVLVDAGDADAAGALVGALLDAGETFQGVSGPEPGVGHAAAAWRARTGGTSAVTIAMRLMATAGALVAPPAPLPAGAPRAPRPADRDLLVGWAEAFAAETGTPPNAATAADTAIAGGRTLLWERDGEPVAVAGHGEPVAGVIRVVFVFTPPAHRRQGLAAAVVAAVCTRAFAAGAARAALYADREDTVATGVYARLGFAACGEAALYTFTR